ncbi:MAG: hypothetical protein KatS3mg131_1495 [Candidatus Tectimicrobiota bacterium]|nr:MAG: hypothetical protein KatS3mg131_1495 [Candidatus Tectomicrobia bacterium]
MRIHRLDPLTVSRIAAGEVIERPASVVKELLDNALDAGSTRIDIELENGGRRLIRVSDNGCGMTAEEAVLALQRFTTSKIRHLDDLRRLTTLGFRGEALPSIAAVAEVELVTRPAAQAEGARVVCRGGEVTVQPWGCPAGTRVSVRQLFAHTPVRRQALKSVAQEVQRVQELVVHYALAYPQVTLQLCHDGRRLLFAPASSELRQRLHVLLGRELASQLLPVHWQSVDLEVRGAVGSPAISRATRQRQYVWVNGRPVRSGLVSAALARAYGALLPPGRHPVAALGISLPAALVDVNVHPRKTEVRFLQERAVFAAVYEAVQLALQALPPETLLPEGTPVAELPAWPEAPPWQVREATVPYRGGGPLRPLGQVGNAFVVAAGAEGLVVLDQHAAHEALLFAALLAAEAPPHELAEPLLLALPAGAQSWLAVLPGLASLGVHLEPFGKDRLLLRAVPSLEGVTATAVREALEAVWQQPAPQATPEAVREQLAAALACRAAVRAGDQLTPEQLTALVDAVAQQHLAYTCPHGRPTFLTMSLADLERRFLRLGAWPPAWHCGGEREAL